MLKLYVTNTTDCLGYAAVTLNTFGPNYYDLCYYELRFASDE